MTNKLRLGLIGCGYMGNYYAHNFSRIPEADIVVCCDPSPDKLQRFKDKWKIPEGTVNWQDLFSDSSIPLDGIINCTVDSLHEEIFYACITHSIPLLTQKPFAVSLKSIARFEKNTLNKVPMIIDFSKRTHSAVIEAKNAVAAGTLGKIHKIEMHYRQGWLYNHDFGDWKESSTWFWRLTENLSHYGVIGDLGSHLLDLSVLFGGKVSEICCTASEVDKYPDELHGEKLNSIDDAVFTLRHENSIVSLLHCSRTIPGEKDTIEILISGDCGSLRVSSLNNFTEYSMYTLHADEWQKIPCSYKLPRNYRHFIHLLLEKFPEDGSFENVPLLADAVYNEILITAAVQSSHDRKVISIPEFVRQNAVEEWG